MPDRPWDKQAKVLDRGRGGGGGEAVGEAQCLQEKNLWTSKEGSMDFDPETSNRMVVEWMERMDADEDDGSEEGGREG